jgi:tRNA 2-thiouridine synthesizing protein E
LVTLKVLLDDEGFLADLDDWDLNVAAWLAENDGVTLLECHIEIIQLLRDYYAKTQVSPAMRVFVKVVKTQLGAELGNSIYLMELFGESPAKTAAKWAGLPRPTNCL